MDLLQSGCYPISQDLTAELAPPAFLNPVFNESRYFAEVVFCYRQFGARSSEAGQNFVSIEGFHPAVSLDHQSKIFFEPFEGGKPPVALRTLSSSPDVVIVLSRTGVKHPSLGVITKLAFHVPPPSGDFQLFNPIPASCNIWSESSSAYPSSK
jgi:hypothetical protein